MYAAVSRRAPISLCVRVQPCVGARPPSKPATQVRRGAGPLMAQGLLGRMATGSKRQTLAPTARSTPR